MGEGLYEENARLHYEISQWQKAREDRERLTTVLSRENDTLRAEVERLTAENATLREAARWRSLEFEQPAEYFPASREEFETRRFVFGRWIYEHRWITKDMIADAKNHLMNYEWRPLPEPPEVEK
jgi:hypothetical protein